MSTDRETIAVYDARSGEYGARLRGRKAEPGQPEFITALPKAAHVLDIGCGPGDCALKFLEAGFSVDAVDPSAGMVARAQSIGVPARIGGFADIDGQDVYDGIFASYSLLHVPREDAPEHLARLHRALKTGGLFHIGMKLGQGSKRDEIGRFYTYYGEEELSAYLVNAGFTPIAQATREDIGLDGQAYRGIWIHARG